MSPDVLRQRLRKASSHEREALLGRLEKDARQTFKVRTTLDKKAKRPRRKGNFDLDACCLQSRYIADSL